MAFLLLAMVLAQRRQPFLSGVVLGIASAMKFTAWPLAVLALFAARGKRGERRPFTMLAGILVVAVPAIFPFALRGPFALIDDVVLFPLGLSAIPSTAASALPGHVLVTEFPSLNRALPFAVGLILAVGLARHLYKHTPRTAWPRSAASPASSWRCSSCWRPTHAWATCSTRSTSSSGPTC